MTFEEFENEFLEMMIDKHILDRLESGIAKQTYIQSMQDVAYRAWMAFGRVLIKNKLKLTKDE